MTFLWIRKSGAALRLFASLLAGIMIFGFSGCSRMEKLDVDSLVGKFSDIVSSLGDSALTHHLFLKGKRSCGTDRYVGTYEVSYLKFSGTEYVFGGTETVDRAGRRVCVTCTYNLSCGNAKVFFQNGSEESSLMLEGSGTVSETYELTGGGCYIGITGDDATGTLVLSAEDSDT